MTKILMVDDDKLVTDLLEKLLKVDGYQTVTVNDSSKAIEIAQVENPDLILLDLMMPQPDGFRVCRMLREIREFKRTPIIIVTALDDSDSRAVAFGAGANDYLTKPFHPDELSEKIIAALEER
ncbi:MAG: OmpR family two-component response regulator [Chloroflexi bacterium OLB14]|nr:MAG: OmpR family two-component response regulator [Chloroflexi bacterium OLB14]